MHISCVICTRMGVIMNIKKIASVLLLLLLSSSLAFASGDYEILEGYPVGKCRLASGNNRKNVQPLPRGQNCSLNVNYRYTGYADGFDLSPPFEYRPSYRGFSFWIEQYSTKAKKWEKITPSRKFARNNRTKQVSFKPKFSGKFRVAFDWYDQAFADRYTEEFTLTLK